MILSAEDTVQRVAVSYALLLRRNAGGAPWVRFDNAHPVEQGVYDYWHRTTKDEGRPYAFTTSLKLLDDFWQEVKRTLNEKGILNDL